MANKKHKKDFDKDKMYSKIMPSFAASPDEQMLNIPPLTGAKAPADKAQPAGTAQQTAPEAPPAGVGTQAAPRTPRYLLRNYIEDIVLEKLQYTMQTLRACTCEKCKKDVMALALNEIAPAYMAIPPDEVDERVRKLRAACEVQVSAALIKAVQAVKGNEQHDL